MSRREIGRQADCRWKRPGKVSFGHTLLGLVIKVTVYSRFEIVTVWKFLHYLSISV